MDEEDIQENIRIFENTIEFLSFSEKVKIVSAIQGSVDNWNQALIDEYKRLSK